MRILQPLIAIIGALFLTLYLLVSNGFLQIKDDKKFQRDFPLNNYRKNSKEEIILLSSSETEQPLNDYRNNAYRNNSKGSIKLISSSEIKQPLNDYRNNAYRNNSKGSIKLISSSEIKQPLNDYRNNAYRNNSKGSIKLLSSSESKQPLNDYRNNPNGHIKSLTNSEIEQIKVLTFFLGHSRSGHSILGSLLDAHPHMIVANEGRLFIRLQEDLSSETPHYTSKSAILNPLWKKSVYSCRVGTRSETEKGTKKGYSLSIDGLYQGAFVPPIQVIGDNNAGRTTDLFIDQPLQWEQVFLKLKSLVNIPIKVLQVIRNPYDNIATAVLYKSVGAPRKVAAVKHSNETLEVNGRIMEHFINRYFNRCQAVQQIKNKFNLTLLEIHGEDLIENPKAIILSICQFLGVSCSDDYLESCKNKLFKTESKTRYRLRWSKEFISNIQDSIMNFDNLKRYSFDS